MSKYNRPCLQAFGVLGSLRFLVLASSLVFAGCSSEPTLTVLAGNGEAGFEDGVGAQVRMHKPIRLAPLGADSIVFADIKNHAIRTLNLEGQVQTLVGGTELQGHRDGPAEQAMLNSPHGVAVRGDGVIAVAEAGGNTVRLLTPVAGSTPLNYEVSTIAGVPGESGWRDGPAEQALFSAPHGIAWGHRGELYVADIGNARLRMIENGLVTTLVGSTTLGHADGPAGIGTLNFPMDLAVDTQGDVWIADAGSKRIRRWRDGVGLDSPLGERTFSMPHGLAVVGGVVVVADMHTHELLEIDIQGGALRTLIGTGEAGLSLTQMNKPAAVIAHAEQLWIADLDNHRIVTLPLSSSK